MYKIQTDAKATLPAPYRLKIIYEVDRKTANWRLYEKVYEVGTTSWNILNILYDSLIRNPYMINDIFVQRLLNYIFFNCTVDTVRTS